MTWESAVELADSIVEKCGELIELAEEQDNSAMDEFASSVSAKAESIGKTIEKNQRVTDRQVTALQNMESGVDNWLERRSR